MIRDELFESAYSQDLTSCKQEPFVERVPYFLALKRLDSSRSIESAKNTEIAVELQQKIKFRDHDLHLLYKKNLALKQNINESESKIFELKGNIQRLEEFIAKMEKEKIEAKFSHQKKLDELKYDLDNLQTTLAQSNHIIEKLSVFKSATDEKSQ
ncbi:hypothetical protein HK096_001533, partial [Nowakowskiella sp. JEL0078]